MPLPSSMFIAAGVGLGATLLSQVAESIFSPNKTGAGERSGRVRRSPSSEGSSVRDVQKAANFGLFAQGLYAGATALSGHKPLPSARLGIFLAATFASSLHSAQKRADDAPKALIASSAAILTGTAIVLGTSRFLTPQLMETLKSKGGELFRKYVPSTRLGRDLVKLAFRPVLHNMNSGTRELLTTQFAAVSLQLGTAAVAMPFVAGYTYRKLAKHERRKKILADATLSPEMLDNIAGDISGRKPPARSIMSRAQLDAEMNLSGQLRTGDRITADMVGY